MRQALPALLGTHDFAAFQASGGTAKTTVRTLRQAALEALRSLGEYTNRYFNAIGGFSARHSRDEILTIFPRKTIEEARKLVADYSRDLERGVIDHIRDIASANSVEATCFDIHIHAGVTEISPEDTIDEIIETGRAKQEIISTYRCDFGGNDQ